MEGVVSETRQYIFEVKCDVILSEISKWIRFILYLHSLNVSFSCIFVLPSLNLLINFFIIKKNWFLENSILKLLFIEKCLRLKYIKIVHLFMLYL